MRQNLSIYIYTLIIIGVSCRDNMAIIFEGSQYLKTIDIYGAML